MATIPAVQMSSQALGVSKVRFPMPLRLNQCQTGTATDITESESSSDISKLSDASTYKLSKLLNFHTSLYKGTNLAILDSYLRYISLP